MPIGIAAGVAGVTAAAGIGSAVISSNAQKKAAKQAAGAAADNTAANNALYREIYGENKAILAPDVNRGNLAGSALTDLLLGTNSYTPALAAFNNGAGSDSAGMISGPQPLTARQQWAQGAIDAMAPRITRQSTWANANAIDDPYQKLQYLLSQSPTTSDQYPLYTSYVAAHADPGPATAALPANGTTAPANGGTVSGDNTGSGAPGSALDAFARFRAGTNYQWRFNQGNDALANQWAARGVFDSGAADRAAIEYGQNFASNELANYMDLLARQQATGLSAASAIAGVSNNYAGNIAASNTAAANAAANAALARGQATQNMWGGIAGALGQGAGILAGGFGGGGAAIPSYASVNAGYTMPTLPAAQPLPSLPGGFW